jgi:hypothetical protein
MATEGRSMKGRGVIVYSTKMKLSMYIALYNLCQHGCLISVS